MAEDSIEHWRSLAAKYKNNVDALQEELNEYTNHSQDLERELEMQLDLSEKSNKELLTANQKLLLERDQLRQRLESIHTDSSAEVRRLDSQLQEVTKDRDNLQQYIRELEQSNDDLERAERNAVVSLEDLERRLNDAIERNVMLESDLDEKEAMNTQMQHMRDEARDLRQELAVREQRSLSRQESTPGRAGSRLPKPANTPSARVTPTQKDTHRRGIAHSATVDLSGGSPMVLEGRSSVPLTPSARISALNIVGDLLRKVGALETKLASNRKNIIPRANEDAPQAKQMLLNGNPPSTRMHSKMKGTS